MTDVRLPAPTDADEPASNAQLVAAEEISFARLISTSIAIRLLFDIAYQIFNPFVSMIARGIGTDLSTFGLMLSLRNAMGLFSPLFGAYADRHSYRTIMRLGILLAAAGMFIVAASNRWC